jgi:hypothetical protein
MMQPGSRGARLRGLAVLGLVLAHFAGRPPDVRGAGIFRDLTARDRSQPIVLSQTGEPIALGSPGHLRPILSAGMVPAYLAFPLQGGEHFPAHTPTLATGPQPGQGVGPLDLTPMPQAQLNADLIASRGAVVDAPDQSYAVSFLPRYAQDLSHVESSDSSSTAGSNVATGLASILGLNAPASSWYINGISAKQLSQWWKTGSNELSHLTSLGVGDVGKTLGLKLTPTSSGLNVAAQELIPPSSTNPAPQPLPVPAPEPGAWLVFALLLGAAGLRRRSGKAGRIPAPDIGRSPADIHPI